MLAEYPIIKNNNYIKVNILKKNKFLSRNNNITILRSHNSNSSFKSFNPKKLEKNNKKLVENIRYNKYLIPMIEKKKIGSKNLKSKFKDAPSYISDFFTNVRQNSERKKTESDIYRQNNPNFAYSSCTNHSLDKINYYTNNYNNINNNYNKNAAKLINNISFNNYITYSKKDMYFPYLIENNITKTDCLQIKDPSHQNDNLVRDDKIFLTHKKFISSLINDNNNFNENIKENAYHNDIIERRIIYPRINGNCLSNCNNGYYLKNIKTKNNRNNQKNIKNDFDNYLQNKKLFLIYRAKLFKLLYASLSKIFNNSQFYLKLFAFNILKNDYIQKRNDIYINKKNIVKRIYPNHKSINSRNILYNMNYTEYKIRTRLNNYRDNQSKNRNNEKYNFNNSLNRNRCFDLFKSRNESDSKERKDNSELCRNRNYLKEKFEEIQKRKHLKYNLDQLESKNIKNITNINNKNYILKKRFTNPFKGVYKKKKFESFSDRDNTPFISHYNIFSKQYDKTIVNEPRNILNYFNIIKKNDNNLTFNTLENKSINSINNSAINNQEEKKKFIMKRVNNLNKKNIKLAKKKINGLLIKKTNKEKDINQLNQYFFRKIIKTIKSSDKRLFVNINYVYLSNIETKGKNAKYRTEILKIKNSDNFSIIQKPKKNIIAIKGRLIGIIEEESSNINYTNESNNTIEYKLDKTLQINSNNDKINSINDKYLFSCINFVVNSLKKIITKNSYNYFKKQIKLKIK